MKRTAIVRDMFAPLGKSRLRPVKGPLFEPQVIEEGRPASIWRRLFYHGVKEGIVEEILFLASEEARRPKGHAIVAAALHLADPGDDAALAALSYIGVTAAVIMRGATQWSFPTPAETGEAALIVPVGGRCAPVAECLALLGTHELAPERTAADIADLVAICVSDGKPLSFNGTTAALGAFATRRVQVPLIDHDTGLPVRDGAGEIVRVPETRLRIATNGIAWLTRHRDRARAMATDCRGLAVARVLELPDRGETLLLDRSAFCFRRENNACIIPVDTDAVACPDSAELAEFVAAELKARAKLPAAPQVLGPRDPARIDGAQNGKPR